jgi:hypothetical protein
MHLFARIHFDELNWHTRRYRAMRSQVWLSEMRTVVAKVLTAQPHRSRGGHIIGGDHLSRDRLERQELPLHLIV